MGEEFHAVLKLITGEEIFSLVSVDENDGDSMRFNYNAFKSSNNENALKSCRKIC